MSDTKFVDLNSSSDDEQLEEPVPIAIPNEEMLRSQLEQEHPMLENFQHSETVVLNCPAKKMFELFLSDDALLPFDQF